MEAEAAIHRLVFGVFGSTGILPSQMKLVGCENFDGPNSRRTCAGADPSDPDISTTVDYGDSDTFTLGPDAGLSNSSALFVSLVGNQDQGVQANSLNDPFPPNAVFLGIVEFSDPVPNPEFVFDNLDGLPGVTAVIELSDGQTINAALLEEVLFDSDEDLDGDGRGALWDNCVHKNNPLQEDDGRVNSTDEDGIGNVCQCGDGNGDGPVFSDDVLALQLLLAGVVDDPDAEERCSVADGTECDIRDIVIVGRVTSGAGGTVNQDCPADH